MARAGLGTLVFLVMIGSMQAWGGSAERPTEQVRLVLDRAMEVQSDPRLQGDGGRAQRSKLIRQLISENFLCNLMARESLGERWDSLKPEEREEFRGLFLSLFQDSYTRMVLNFLRKETIEYLGETQEGERFKVRTKILRANEHIPVDYTLVKTDKGWLMVDVTIDGVSILKNYQTKFKQVISSQSFDYLLKQMRIQNQAARDASAS